ncbi:hypothetical protein JKP88DRAFT_268118 [Tribonema minus]|uniref:C3H1-type domain-containing protein n=1 Tax=Tribonema minus TaxID=303371 RepID=A0A836CHD1_9STRA|nr:hypothetical protein JKP88DRAFT_268118 [Tribonema minus]
MQGRQVCRFDTACSRQDCYFAHPNGRMIDGSSGGNGMVMVMPMHAGGGGMGAPGGMANGTGGGGSQKPCRFAWDCRRPDCYFAHPTGRAIDAAGGGGRGGRGGRGGAPPGSAASVNGLMRSFSALSTSSTGSSGMAAAEQDQELADTWFPRSRDCTCCRGFVYGCAGDICAALGKCTCAVEESDMELPPGAEDGGGGGGGNGGSPAATAAATPPPQSPPPSSVAADP